MEARTHTFTDDFERVYVYGWGTAQDYSLRKNLIVLLTPVTIIQMPEGQDANSTYVQMEQVNTRENGSDNE
jgi:hypothetical protein